MSCGGVGWWEGLVSFFHNVVRTQPPFNASRDSPAVMNVVVVLEYDVAIGGNIGWRCWEKRHVKYRHELYTTVIIITTTVTCGYHPIDYNPSDHHMHPRETIPQSQMATVIARLGLAWDILIRVCRVVVAQSASTPSA